MLLLDDIWVDYILWVVGVSFITLQCVYKKHLAHLFHETRAQERRLLTCNNTFICDVLVLDLRAETLHTFIIKAFFLAPKFYK